MATKIICRACGKEAKVNKQRNVAACKNVECDNCNAFYTIGTEGFDRRYWEV